MSGRLWSITLSVIELNSMDHLRTGLWSTSIAIPAYNLSMGWNRIHY
jgi:hypothetical protein